jgi:hypothetical protein
MALPRFTAIVVVKNQTFEFKKYRNISREFTKLERFKNFVKSKFPNAVYINLYDGKTKEYIRRERFN